MVLWSLDTRKPAQEWPGSQLFCPIAFSPDGLHIGTGGYSIRVWEIGEREQPVVASSECATSCDFSPDGKIFAAFGAEQPLMCWEMPAGAPRAAGWGGTRASNNNLKFPVGGMTFHPHRAIVANCYGVLGQRGYDSVIHLWETANGALVDTIEMKYGHNHPYSLVFSPDGTLLAAETGPILHIWDIDRHRQVATFQVSKKHFKSFAFTPDGRTLLAVNSETELRGWDTTAWQENTPTDGRIGKLTALAVSAEGRIAIGSATGNIALL